MKKEVLFIINPISGTRHKQSIPEEIERWLDHTLFDHEIKFTTHAGHASELTKEAAENGVDIVVAVGGDGTVNEVARSLVHTLWASSPAVLETVWPGICKSPKRREERLKF